VATTGGGWIVRANQYGRAASLVVLALFGVTLLLPTVADWISRPFVRLGSSLALSPDSDSKPGSFRSFLLGIATGLLWAPCAGPILGLILTGAALEGTNTRTLVLLLAYAAGAATSLAVALLAGGRVFAALKRSLGVEVWIRQVLGIAVLAGVAMIALGLDRGVLTKLSLASTSGVEQSLIDRIRPDEKAQAAGHHDDVCQGARDGLRTGNDTRPLGRRSVDQFSALEPRSVERQSRPGGLLDVLLHQLPAHTALHPGMGGKI
jgi:cytochrome c biogenesis protein CcdA